MQEALSYTFTRLDWFESKRASALRAYLRRVAENRIRDELRSGRRGAVTRLRRSNRCGRPRKARQQLRRLVDDEAWRRYVDGLQRLRSRDRRLIAGRFELGYNYRQLALVERMPRPDAARMALGRALTRLGAGSCRIRDAGPACSFFRFANAGSTLEGEMAPPGAAVGVRTRPSEGMSDG